MKFLRFLNIPCPTIETATNTGLGWKFAIFCLVVPHPMQSTVLACYRLLFSPALFKQMHVRELVGFCNYTSISNISYQAASEVPCLGEDVLQYLRGLSGLLEGVRRHLHGQLPRLRCRVARLRGNGDLQQRDNERWMKFLAVLVGKIVSVSLKPCILLAWTGTSLLGSVMTSCCPLEVEAAPIAPEAADAPDAEEPPTLN